MITGLCGNSFTSLEIMLTLSQHATQTTDTPLQKREKDWGQNVPRNGFWDRYWGQSQKSSRKLTRPSLFLVFKVANGALFLPNANAKFSNPYFSGTAQIALCQGVSIFLCTQHPLGLTLLVFSCELNWCICQASVLPRCSDSLSLSLAKSSKIRSSSSCLSGPLRQKK